MDVEFDVSSDLDFDVFVDKHMDVDTGYLAGCCLC